MNAYRLFLLRLRIHLAEFQIVALEALRTWAIHRLYALHRERKDMLLEHFAAEQDQPCS